MREASNKFNTIFFMNKWSVRIERRSTALASERFVLSFLIAVTSGLSVRACNDDPVKLDPVETTDTCTTSFDGNCTWKYCESGDSWLVSCQVNPGPTEPPPIDPPPPPPPPPPPDPGTDPDGCEVNKFTARDGNARRQIDDLTVAGAARGILLWARHHNTVPREGKEYFGFSASWRHNWQYDLLERIIPGQANPSYTFINPAGARHYFQPNMQGGWSGTSTWFETLEKTADGFDLTNTKNTRLHFVRYKKPNGYNDYRLERITDPQGLDTHLVYNSQGLLSKVTEPAGRSLTIVYKDVPYDTGRFDQQMATIPNAPTQGQWIDLPMPENLRGKTFQDFCLFGEKEGKLAVAEMQFFSANNPNPLLGKATGTGAAPEAAFDGNINSGFAGNREADNALAFRLNDPAVIDHVRILAIAGQEESVKGAWLEAYQNYSTARTAVAKVTGSDGSSVEYDYQAKLYNWQIGPASSTVELISVRYADGTKATYQYSLAGANRKPLLVEADDPRYVGTAKRIKYSYHDRQGMIHQEINPETQAAYATLELDPKDTTKRTVTYSDLRQVSFVFSPNALGRPAERKDGLGRVTRYEYSDKGKGLLAAEIDHHGNRKEYTYDSQGRVLSKQIHGRKSLSQRDSLGRESKSVDQYTRETLFTRDAKGRLTKLTKPDGTSQEYGYDELGRRTFFRDVDGSTHSFTFDARGLRSAWKNPKGGVTTYTYDARDRVASTTDPLGQKTSFEYNDAGQTTKITRPDGTSTRYSYDKYGRKIAQTDAMGRTTRFAYDSLARIIEETDEKGQVTHYDYTELPNGCSSCTLVSHPSTITYPDGRVTKNLYDTGGRLISRTENAGTSIQATTSYTYDDQDNLIAVEDALGRTTRHTYDDENHRLSTTDPMGRTALFSYDSRGNLVKTTAPDDTATRFTYDINDRRISETDSLGQVTQLTYDTLGNVTSIKDPAGTVTRFAYDGKKLIAKTYADGKQETYQYDGLGRVVSSTSPDGVVTTTTYDAGNNVISVKRVLPNGAAVSTTNTFDRFGHQTSATDALNRTTRYTYDERGNRVATVRSDGLKTTQEYDAQDRPISSTDALGQVTRFTYNATGSMTSLADARGSVYRFIYDSANRRTAMIYPDGSRETWTYDLAGQLTKYVNRAGQAKIMSYNSSGQIVSEMWTAADSSSISSAGPVLASSVSYAYNKFGRLESIDNRQAKLQYTYDQLERLVNETVTLSTSVANLPAQTISYGYNELGRRATLGYPDGSKVGYSYDLLGRLVGIQGDRAGRQLANYAYDELGRVANLRRDNDVVTSYNYDAANQLTAIEHAKGLKVLARVQYTLDVLGRRTSQTRENNVTEKYQYDATSQLSHVDYGSGGAETFAYDALGNRMRFLSSASGSETSISYESNRLNQYMSVAGVALVYDANGNLIDDGRQQYRYDSQNRLIGVQSQAVKAEFYYDPLNRCVLRKYYSPGERGQWTLNPEESRALVYDKSWNVIAERRLDGALVAKYVHGLRLDEVLSARFGANDYFPLQDGLGSTIVLADSRGGVVERYRYSAYGEPTSLTPDFQTRLTPSIGFRHLFTGREWIFFVKLNDHRNRYYCASLGRWNSMDPIRFKGRDTNLYGYVYNSPITNLDPEGLSCRCGERVNAVRQVGPIDAMTAADLADQARQMASTLAPQFPDGVAGISDGTADAFRHCFWSCRMAQVIGPEQARLIGNVHEECNPGTAAATSMDQHNNAAGRAMGTPGANCAQSCADGTVNGALQTKL